jgi:hypothetical protein
MCTICRDVYVYIYVYMHTIEMQTQILYSAADQYMFGADMGMYIYVICGYRCVLYVEMYMYIYIYVHAYDCNADTNPL